MFNADGMRRKPLLVLFMMGFAPAALVVVIRCASLGASLGRSWIAKPQVTLKRVQARELTPDGVTLVFGLLVQNPNSFALKVDAVRYEVELNGKAFSQGRLDQPAEVPSKGENIVDIPVPVKLRDLFAQLIDFFTTRSSKYRIKGSADFGVVTVPFESSGDVKF